MELGLKRKILREEENMNRAQIISFDMDGTLTEMAFVNSVWLRGVPELYAQKNKISFEEALFQVKHEYNKVGRERLEWYDLSYWLNKFEINTTPEQILKSFADNIRAFEDVHKLLEKLIDRRYRLIVLTNARREFADLEMDKTGMKRYFENVFSSPSDFKLIKNGTTIYEKVCIACQVPPTNMIHVGDDPNFDFEVPKRIGIRAFLLDRDRKRVGKDIVHNLEEFGQRIYEFTKL